jgi:hypothetical protein
MRDRLRSKSGVSLVETLIAVTLLSLVLAAMVGVLLQQQRFYLVTGDAANTVAIVQRVEAALTSEFMPLNPSAGDAVYAGADSFALRAFRGVYAVCAKRLTSELLLTVKSLAGGPALRVDSALVYSVGAKPTVSDDSWRPVEITSVHDDTCPDSTQAWTAVIPGGTALLSEVPIGAPFRVFHRASYWLTTEDGSWYLKTDALSGSPMVVSGPLAPADSAATSVLRFRYLDTTGNPTTDLAAISGMEIEVAAVGTVARRRGGTPLRKNRTMKVKLRNAAGWGGGR